MDLNITPADLVGWYERMEQLWKPWQQDLNNKNLYYRKKLTSNDYVWLQRIVDPGHTFGWLYYLSQDGVYQDNCYLPITLQLGEAQYAADAIIKASYQDPHLMVKEY